MTRSWLIGCGAECDVIVARPGVSAHHCRLTRGADGVVLEDLGSPDGTFVNGVWLRAPARVTPGDAVTLGPNTPLPWPDEAIPPGWRILRIGRESDNDFLVNLATVSGYHARVIRGGATGEATIEDLGSSNGTSLGSLGRKVTRAVLAATDTVYLGSHTVPAAVLLARLSDARVPPPLLFLGREMTVGRDPGCDRVVDLPIVSGRHAQLTRSGGEFLIEDLGSSNGTFVNGRRIERPVVIKPGDQITLGNYTLEFAVEDPAAAGREAPGNEAAGFPPVALAAAPAPATAVQGNGSLPRSSEIPPTFAGTLRLHWRWAALVVIFVGSCVATTAWIARRGGETDRNTELTARVATQPTPDVTARRSQEAPAGKDEGNAGRSPVASTVTPVAPAPPPVVHELASTSPVKPPSPDPPATGNVELPPPGPPSTSPVKSPSDQPPAPVVAWADSLDLSSLKPDDETALGGALHQMIMRHVRATDEESWGERAEEAARRVSNANYTITILDSDAVNAFSHPGGYIYVSRGLFNLIGNDEDYILEFALGHEIAHLELQHALNCVKKGAEEAKKHGIDTLNQFLIPIAVGFPDAPEFEADAWIFKRMVTGLDRTKRETLAFLRKYKEHAKRNGFAKGRELPSPEFPLAANHYRAHPAAGTRLARLESLFEKPLPGTGPPR